MRYLALARSSPPLPGERDRYGGVSIPAPLVGEPVGETSHLCWSYLPRPAWLVAVVATVVTTWVVKIHVSMTPNYPYCQLVSTHYFGRVLAKSFQMVVVLPS